MYAKMNTDIKERWVKALRSGDYVQTFGTLYNAIESVAKGKPCCCCLGVLENVCGTPLSSMIMVDFPESVENMASPVGVGDGEISALLADMNDGAGSFLGNQQSFVDIADWIEENL